MHTQQKQQPLEIDSPFKELSKQIDNPAEQEAKGWESLSYNEKRILCRGANVSSIYWNTGWEDLYSEDRMEIRIVLNRMSGILAAFGGLHA